MHRLGATLAAHAGRPLEDLSTQVTETLATQASSDDVTLLLVRTNALSPTQVASWDLPNEPFAVRTARHVAARQLSEWGLERLVTTTELIVSELLSNAIHHSTGPIRLRLIQHQVLT
ncbi:hypothetical protein OHB49_20660 [Streptomyces sp. NBC_01717]